MAIYLAEDRGWTMTRFEAVKWIFDNYESPQFVLLSYSNGDMYVKAADSTVTYNVVIQHMERAGIIGIVPRSIGYSVFAKDNPSCLFHDNNAPQYGTRAGRDYWYSGYREDGPTRICTVGNSGKHVCGKVIGSEDSYVELGLYTVILLAEDLNATNNPEPAEGDTL